VGGSFFVAGSTAGRGGEVQEGNGSAVDPDTAEAAEASPSPLVAASFGTGRGGRGRGRSSGRGRGRGGRGRQSTVVASMIASKTWTRPRTMDDSLETER